MLNIYRMLYDKIIARTDAEAAHRLALDLLQFAQRAPSGLAWLRRWAGPADPRLAVQLWGLSFPNPLGVAAGLDKNAEAFAALFALGFGHVEVGTVTLRPQPGNPRPRAWRAPQVEALVNAFGFPSDGAPEVLLRVGGAQARRDRECASQILGINLGKNATTELDRAAADYVALIDAFFDAASYFVVNLSSPNTPGLRELQLKERFAELLSELVAANQACAVARAVAPRPLLVKLAPDLDDLQLEELATLAADRGAAGLVATNTTIERQGLPADLRHLPGGVSGAPLFQRANHVIGRLYQAVGERLPIIGVGGVFSAADLIAHMEAGASLVQLYTGLVYRGPRLPAQIAAGLRADADARGWRQISELVGQRFSSSRAAPAVAPSASVAAAPE